MRRHMKINRIGPWVLLFAAVFFTGCAEKIINGTSGINRAQVSFKIASPLASTLVGLVRLTVTGPGILKPIVDTLDYVDGYLVGQADIPSGRDRQFILEVQESTTITAEGLILYRGATTVDILPNATANIFISLYPVVPMVRLTPRFLPVVLRSDFALGLKVYNLDSLSSITTRLHYQHYEFRVDSVIIDKSLPLNTVFWVQIDSLSNYLIHIGSLPNLNAPIVDNHGYSNLATIYFHSQEMIDTIQAVDSSDISLWPYSIHFATGDTTVPDSLRIGPSTIEIHRNPGSIIGKESVTPMASYDMEEYSR